MTRAAANVVVDQSELPAGVELLSDDDSSTPVEKLSPGLSVVYRRVVRPTQTGMMLLQPAKVKYAPAVGSIEEQIGFSTAASVMVMTTNEYAVAKILLMVMHSDDDMEADACSLGVVHDTGRAENSGGMEALWLDGGRHSCPLRWQLSLAEALGGQTRENATQSCRVHREEQVVKHRQLSVWTHQSTDTTVKELFS